MDPNTHSTQPPSAQPTDAGGQPEDELAALAGDVDAMAAQDVTRLSATARTQRLLAWQRLLDRQHGLWLKELAALDACGAAGVDQGERAASTVGWLRRRLRLSVSAAHGSVRAARALFRGPLPETRGPGRRRHLTCPWPGGGRWHP